AELKFPQAIQPGNYRLHDAANRPVAGFSLDVRATETDLDRVGIDVIESSLGEGSVVQVGRSARLRDALAGARRPPGELVPDVMRALLVVRAGEGLLATLFYRRPPATEEAAPAGPVVT